MKKRMLSMLLVLSMVLCGVPSLARMSVAADGMFRVTVKAADGGKVSTDGDHWQDSVVVSVADGDTIGDRVLYRADEGYRLDSVIAPTAVKKVVTAATSTAVIDASGNLYTAGDNARGQLGRRLGYPYRDFVLTKADISAKVTDVAMGNNYIVVLDKTARYG